MAIRTSIGVNDQGQTFDAVPIPFGVFEFPQNTSAVVRFQVIALRSDFAMKAWSGEIFVKKNGGTLAVNEMIPTPANIFASAADEVTMATVTIALFTDGTYVGVTCTGQAGQTIDWLIDFVGSGFTQ